MLVIGIFSKLLSCWCKNVSPGEILFQNCVTYLTAHLWAILITQLPLAFEMIRWHNIIQFCKDYHFTFCLTCQIFCFLYSMINTRLRWKTLAFRTLFYLDLTSYSLSWMRYISLCATFPYKLKWTSVLFFFQKTNPYCHQSSPFPYLLCSKNVTFQVITLKWEWTCVLLRMYF